jgi:hypothetical protein
LVSQFAYIRNIAFDNSSFQEKTIPDWISGSSINTIFSSSLLASSTISVSIGSTTTSFTTPVFSIDPVFSTISISPVSITVLFVQELIIELSQEEIDSVDQERFVPEAVSISVFSAIIIPQFSPFTILPLSKSIQRFHL